MPHGRNIQASPFFTGKPELSIPGIPPKRVPRGPSLAAPVVASHRMNPASAHGTAPLRKRKRRLVGPLTLTSHQP